MLHRFFAIFFAAVFFASPVVAQAHSSHQKYTTADANQDIEGRALTLYATESSAQKACPRDEVVWLNTNSGIYHEKGMRWYGRTRMGAYVCRKQADKAGNRDTYNGQ